ncbi:MAG TPA: YfhO family protein, partial [Vicinamibacteria bacterium]|nr:YfhO family protein [Vicinamibacteria bacterium]
LNATAPRALLAAPPQITSHLPTTGFVRLVTWDYLSRLLGKPYRRESPRIPWEKAPRDSRPSLAAALARRAFLSPPTAARFGFFGSFDRDWLGLQPRGVHHLSLWFQRSEETPELLRLLRVGGVTHTVGLHDEGLEELEPVAIEVSDFAGPVYLKRVPGARPRVYAVDGARVADGLRALQLLVDPGFDPGQEIVKESGEATVHDPAFASECRLVQEQSDRLLIEARLDAPGYVVALDAFDPGWIARLDGHEVALLRANVGFRAVAVPAGRHEVEMLYRPRGLWPGLAASGVAFLLVLGSLVPGRRPRPPGHAEAAS